MFTGKFQDNLLQSLDRSYRNRRTVDLSLKYVRQKVLSVGCGDGSVEFLIKKRLDNDIVGLEVINYLNNKNSLIIFLLLFPAN